MLANTSENCRTLSNLRGETVVLAFCPAEWDPARSEQIVQYNKILDGLLSSRAKLIDLAVDAGAYHLAFQDERISIPFVSNIDSNGPIGRLYGADGRNALFVIDEAGVVRWSYVAPTGIFPKAEDLVAGLRSTKILPDADDKQSRGLTRRQFIAAALASAFVLVMAQHQGTAYSETSASGATRTGMDASNGPIVLRINGSKHRISVDPRVTLLDALREYIGLTGSKKGCDHGQCGACTLLIDGRRVLSCLTLAAAAEGKEIVTIEGVASGESLAPMQNAFIRHDGFQCGYCTPGQIMSAVGLLAEPCGSSDSDVREMMSGNICRCGAYPNIIAAIQDVRKGATDASV